MKKNAAHKKVCGIIMPISTMKVGELTYTSEYWNGVLAYLCDAIKDAGFEPVVAWENNKSDIIHAKIVQNIESQDVMLAVLVGNNPNVWLECGMRLWAQKPVLLLLSDKAEKIPFDVSPINCLRFPEDCHYGKLKTLKKEIKDSLKRITDPNHPSILSHFAAIKPTSGTPSVKEEDLSKFMTETRAAISRLEAQVETCQAVNSSSSYDLSRLHLPYSDLSGVASTNTYALPEYMRDMYRHIGQTDNNVTHWLSGLNGATGPTGPTKDK